MSEMGCENVVHVLHWFLHFRSPFNYFFELVIRPFNKRLWIATTPETPPKNDFICCHKLQVDFIKPHRRIIDWMAEWCSRHVKSEKVHWTMNPNLADDMNAVLVRLADFIIRGNKARLIKKFELGTLFETDFLLLSSILDVRAFYFLLPISSIV